MPQTVPGFINLITSGTCQLQALNMLCFNVIPNIAQFIRSLSTLKTLPQGTVLSIHSFSNVRLNKGLKLCRKMFITIMNLCDIAFYFLWNFTLCIRKLALDLKDFWQCSHANCKPPMWFASIWSLMLPSLFEVLPHWTQSHKGLLFSPTVRSRKEWTNASSSKENSSFQL